MFMKKYLVLLCMLTSSCFLLSMEQTMEQRVAAECKATTITVITGDTFKVICIKTGKTVRKGTFSGDYYQPPKIVYDVKRKKKSKK